MISNFNMPNPNETTGDKGEETRGLQPTRTWPRKRRDPGEESRADSDSDATQEAKPEFAAEVEIEDIDGDSERARREREKMAIEEKIASFFEDRTFFYDVAHEDYKNKTRKDAELAEFAAVIGYDAAAVWKRFTSNRTDYGKLKNRKSWQGAKKLTNLQTFKLTRYKFLDAHITSRSYSEETGKVHIIQASYGVDDDDDIDLGGDGGCVEDDWTRPDLSNEGRKRSSSTESKRPRKKAKEPEVVDLLSQMIEDNRRRNMEAEKKIEAMAAEKLQNERDTWGSWLMSAAQGIPAESWRSFQRDTFEVALRYLPPEGIGAPAPVISAATATYPTPISLHKS